MNAANRPEGSTKELQVEKLEAEKLLYDQHIMCTSIPYSQMIFFESLSREKCVIEGLAEITLKKYKGVDKI